MSAAPAAESLAKTDACKALVLNGVSPADALRVTGLTGFARQMTQADVDEFTERWRRLHATGRHQMVVLSSETTFTPLPSRACSYCRAEVYGARCGNCGAPREAAR